VSPTLRPADVARLRDAAKGVGGGLAVFAAVQIAGAYMAKNRTGAAAVQALIAEIGAGWLAVTWSDPHGPLPTAATIGRRLAKGAGLGAAAAVLVALLALATHAASLARGTPVIADMVFGLLLACLLAARDELILRGIVLRAMHHAAPTPVALGVCGLAAAAASFGMTAASADPAAAPLRAALVAGLSGVAFAALWKRDRGAWLAWGAHVAWLWVKGPITRGGLVDLQWAPGPWGGGDAGLDGSIAAAVGLTVVALAAASWALAEKPASPARALG
jgi:hypothetical protein